MFLSWSAFYEGRSDALYFNVLIPRLLEEIIREEGIRPCDVGILPSVEFGVSKRTFDVVAKEICDRKDEFHVIFIHADLGGRALGETVHQRREALINKAVEICEFNAALAVLLSPEKELEAWVLADHAAIMAAFGISEIPDGLLPANPREAERLPDPKSTLQNITRVVSGGKRSASQILVRVAQEQNINELRRARSFQAFEKSLKGALKNLRFIQNQK